MFCQLDKSTLPLWGNNHMFQLLPITRKRERNKTILAFSVSCVLYFHNFLITRSFLLTFNMSNDSHFKTRSSCLVCGRRRSSGFCMLKLLVFFLCHDGIIKSLAGFPTFCVISFILSKVGSLKGPVYLPPVSIQQNVHT